MENLGFEEIFCVLLFIFFGMSGYIPLVSPNQAVDPAAAVGPGGLAAVVGIGSQVLALLMITLLLLRRFHQVLRSVSTLHWAGLVVILALLSTVWSQDPVLTARRSISFLFSTLFALYFAVRFPIRRQVSILWLTMIVLACGTIAVTILVPQYGLDVSPGHTTDWKGVFTQKNACGRAMVFATAITFAMGRLNLARVLALLVFLFVLAMSGSRSFWLIEIGLALFAALLTFLKRHDSQSRIIIVGCSLVLSVVLVALALFYGPLLLSAMGRDATLTGRSAIWHEAWHAITKHPFIGYGYSAFWLGLKGESFNVIAALGFVVLHAHNGFLELWLELGCIGLAIFSLSYWRACLRAWRMLRTKDLETPAWPIYVLLLILLSDLDENTLLIFNGMFWILYVTALVNLEMMLRSSLGNRQLREEASVALLSA